MSEKEEKDKKRKDGTNLKFQIKPIWPKNPKLYVIVSLMTLTISKSILRSLSSLRRRTCLLDGWAQNLWFVLRTQTLAWREDTLLRHFVT
jgi:hypothetical protein